MSATDVQALRLQLAEAERQLNAWEREEGDVSDHQVWRWREECRSMQAAIDAAQAGEGEKNA